MKYLRIFCICLAITAIFSCIKVKELATLTTTEAKSITVTSAISGGNITSNGGADITSRGAVWSTSTNPVISGSHTTDSTGPGSFNSTLTGLTPNTLYHVRAYAINSVGTAYGDEINFTTLDVVNPALTTSAVSSVTASEASSGGNITADGGMPVTARGVCWSTSTNPTISNDKTEDGTGTGSFTSTLTDLRPNTTYYVRAYATNNSKTGYGNEVSFTNPINPIIIKTDEVSSKTYNSAVCGGEVINDGGLSITSRGICWSKSHNPSLSDSVKLIGTGTGKFESLITGFVPGTIYFVRSFATNNLGTLYGNEISFVYHFPNCGTIIDADGNSYNTVSIGSQCWMAENLKTTRYINGDFIGTTSPASFDISGESSPEYQWAYNGDVNNVATYGRLYTWFAITDVRKVCPEGWHIPSVIDWGNFYQFLLDNGYGYEGSGNDYAKSIAAQYTWLESLTPGSVGNDQSSNNSSGFTGQPGGWRDSYNVFSRLGESGIWFSSRHSWGSTYYYHLDNTSGQMTNGELITDQRAMSARCILGESPLCNTLLASNITSTGVTLNGLVNPNNMNTEVTFDIGQYGGRWTMSYTATQSPLTGRNIVNVNADIKDLTPGTMYYFRILAVSSTGQAEGQVLTFKTLSGKIEDVDGNSYNTITTGTQQWMTENLKTTRYNNGDVIGTTYPPNKDISGDITPKYQWAYDGDELNAATYGRLYTYYAVTDIRNVCPTGWHVPSDDDWTILTDYLIENGYGYSSGDNIAKSLASQTQWAVSNISGASGYQQKTNNKSGFGALPGGTREYYIGIFDAINYTGYWLSTSELDADNVRFRSLGYNETILSRYFGSKKNGFSVRCLKDN